ncbi:hypothetical protein Bbelb_290590 [Branchiostoma belcheri]|nr:hypothetical protein Bbelb_290590 [Branchiostoma belcheri]
MANWRAELEAWKRRALAAEVTKKLAGAAAGAADWVTNVGNEHGQILMSVLTAAEGQGLKPMGEGLVRRYRAAGVEAPRLLHVDILLQLCTTSGRRYRRGSSFYKESVNPVQAPCLMCQLQSHCDRSLLYKVINRHDSLHLSEDADLPRLLQLMNTSCVKLLAGGNGATVKSTTSSQKTRQGTHLTAVEHADLTRKG